LTDLGLLFVCGSILVEAAFIVLFVYGYFDGFLQTLMIAFPGNGGLQNFSGMISKLLGPMITNLRTVLYLWTLTSMAVTIEVVFAPLLISD